MKNILVKRIRFTGYKSFNGLLNEINVEVPISLIIGRNNSGKSSVIDVIEYIFNIFDMDTSVDNHTEIELSFEILEEYLKYFDKNTSGGGISGNHREYARKYIGDLLSTKLISRRDLVFKGIDSIDETMSAVIKSKWNSTASLYSHYTDQVVFRRINADRNIVPETESRMIHVGYNGEGTTNLVRLFVNDSRFDESVVESRLLNELNTIMGSDTHFESIRVQQISDEGQAKWEIFLKESNNRRIALSNSGSGLKTVILLLVNLYLIPEYENAIKNDITYVYAFEELENNLHPALQRRLFEYLYAYVEHHNCLMYLTTHSHVAINIFYGKEKSSIYHITRDHGLSSIKLIESYLDKAEILNDLDVKASDLLQANGIIWVEGPSDRIYIKKWLEVFSDNNLSEGIDYQFLYYGGRLLSHYSAEEDHFVDGLISIFTTNRNAAIVMDSDKTNKHAGINKTKRRIQSEFNNLGCICWITKGKEIENYLTANSINKSYGCNLNDVGQFELFPEYIKKTVKNFTNKKVDTAM